jgi:cyclic beta-1,2-glucan synthetase
MLRAASDFATFDFPTRDLYRRAIEELARGSEHPEIEVTRLALSAAHHAGANAQTLGEATLTREQDPGYYLIAKGRAAFERTIGFHGTLSEWLIRTNSTVGISGYVCVVAIVTAIVLGLILNLVAVHGASRCFWELALVALLPASDAAIALVNYSATNDHDQIEEAPGHRDVSDVGAPHLIDPFDRDPAEQIGVNFVGRCRLARVRPLVDRH